MKTIYCLFIFVLISILSEAQYYRRDGGFRLGVNAQYTYPLGDFSDVAKNGFGGNISGKYLINDVIGIGFETGYHAFKQSDKMDVQSANQTHETKYRLIPVLVEGTFYIPTWDRTLLPYLGIHFGAYITNINIKQSDIYSPENNAKENLWRFSPGVGAHIGLLIELSEYVDLDIKIRGDYVPKIKEDYDRDELGNKGYIGFNKMLNIGGNIGLLYKF